MPFDRFASRPLVGLVCFTVSALQVDIFRRWSRKKCSKRITPSANIQLEYLIGRATLLLSQPPHQCISQIKKPTEFRSHNGCTVQQRGRKQWSPGAKLRIQSFPSVCNQVGWQGASAGWWLSGGSDSLSQGDQCHMPVCPQRWRLTRPTRPGPLVMPSLSGAGRLWQLTRHLGHGRQGPEHCYLYRHQDLLLPRRRKRKEVWRRRREGEREHTQNSKRGSLAEVVKIYYYRQ